MTSLRGARRLCHLGIAILAGQGGQRLLLRDGRSAWRQLGRLGFASSSAGSATRHTSSTERWQVRKEYTRIRKVETIPEGDAVRELTLQIQRYAKEYEEVVIEEFFHRKSGRVVLAVLHVEHEGRSEYVRGINSEVSLPAGSTCAERGAIHKALTMPGIRRKDMKGIAVVEVPGNFGDNVTRTASLNPLQPCGVCKEYLEKIQMESPGFYVLTFPDLTFSDVHERLLFWSVQEESMQPEALGPWACRFCNQMNVPLSHTCMGCQIDRFSFLYTGAPSQQRYFDVLAALVECEVPITKKTLRKRLEKAGRSPLSAEEFVRTMARLVRPPLEYTPLVIETENGLYSITYEGRQLVAKRAAGKPGRANGTPIGGESAGPARPP